MLFDASAKSIQRETSDKHAERKQRSGASSAGSACEGTHHESQRGVILWFWISSPKARPHLNPEELTVIACVGCVGLLQMKIRREEDTFE